MALNLSNSSTSKLHSIRLGDDLYSGCDLPSPADFGLPTKYTSWRKWQYQTVERILASPKRFFGLCAPCGSGKSIDAMAAAVMGGRRTVILTSTLGLQTQVANDFDSIAKDIRGMANYTCVAAPGLGLSSSTTVSEAPCQMGYKCSLRFGGGCEYFDKYREAQKFPIVVTNYMCWMYDKLKIEGSLHIPRAEYEANKLLGPGSDPRIPVDMLIADEGDLVIEELSRVVSVDISRREVLHLGLEWPESGLSIEDWKQWADDNQAGVERKLAALEKRLAGGSAATERGWSRDLKALRDINRKLQRLAGIRVEDEWVMQEFEGDEQKYSKSPIVNLKSVQFSPLSPARYAESALWRGVEKVVLMSATLTPKTLTMLGIAEDEMEFIEVPSTFPVERRPIIHVVSGVQMNFRTERDDIKMTWFLNKLDSYIKPRLELGRKGVIHGVSYSRSQFIKDNSEWGRYMLTHNSHDKAQVIRRYRESDEPLILISPVVDVGHSFDDDLARWGVIAKIPFPSLQDKLVKLRQARDPEYTLYLVAQTLQQMCGRFVRSEIDWGEVAVLDDNFFWLLPKIRKFVSESWLAAVSRSDTIPPPIEF